jgi:hypothetical protein
MRFVRPGAPDAPDAPTALRAQDEPTLCTSSSLRRSSPAPEIALCNWQGRTPAPESNRFASALWAAEWRSRTDDANHLRNGLQKPRVAVNPRLRICRRRSRPPKKRQLSILRRCNCPAARNGTWETTRIPSFEVSRPLANRVELSTGVIKTDRSIMRFEPESTTPPARSYLRLLRWDMDTTGIWPSFVSDCG